MTYNTVKIEEFPPIIREFASYKSVIQGCSEKTVSEYLSDLRTFFRYLIAREKGIPFDSDEFLEIDIRSVDLDYVRSVKPEDIYEFLLYTDNVRKNLWCAKARKLSAIKVFYKYVVNKKNWMETSPAVNIESPKPKKSLPKFLSLEECRALLSAVDSDRDSPTRVRDYAMITMFLNCGMRLSELVGINLSDMDSELRSLRVIGKGSKERVIYLNEACRSALADYLVERRGNKFSDCTSKALFLSSRKQRISNKTVQFVVQKYLFAAGLESRHYSVHKLRHTAATLMYQSGKVDIRVLKDILGHEQLNTTQIYTHVSNKSMEDAMSMNPLSAVKPEKKNEEEEFVQESL